MSDIINKYKIEKDLPLLMESNKLGKEKMGRLIFMMALPTVTAQIVNLLYNIVRKRRSAAGGNSAWQRRT